MQIMFNMKKILFCKNYIKKFKFKFKIVLLQIMKIIILTILYKIILYLRRHFC